VRDEWNECQGLLDDGVFASEHFADTEVAGHDAWRGWEREGEISS
jgi:hypothetical protein